MLNASWYYFWGHTLYLRPATSYVTEQVPFCPFRSSKNNFSRRRKTDFSPKLFRSKTLSRYFFLYFEKDEERWQVFFAMQGKQKSGPRTRRDDIFPSETFLIGKLLTIKFEKPAEWSEAYLRTSLVGGSGFDSHRKESPTQSKVFMGRTRQQ